MASGYFGALVRLHTFSSPYLLLIVSNFVHIIKFFGDAFPVAASILDRKDYLNKKDLLSREEGEIRRKSRAMQWT